MVNGKDLVAGTIDTSLRTSLIGTRRAVNLRPFILPTRRDVVGFGAGLRTYGAKVFLRRVR
jgi:hypothetical protein